MKKIEAVIRPEKLASVKQALEKAGYSGITISEVEGHGKQKGLVQQWRGEKYKVELLPKVKVELVAKDIEVDSILKAIQLTARTGEIGDGKIFIYPCENTVRIRTGEKGESAL